MTNPLILLYWAQLQGIEAAAALLDDPTDHRFDRRTVGQSGQCVGETPAGGSASTLPLASKGAPTCRGPSRKPAIEGAPYAYPYKGKIYATPYRPIPTKGGPTEGGTYTGVPPQEGGPKDRGPMRVPKVGLAGG